MVPSSSCVCIRWFNFCGRLSADIPKALKSCEDALEDDPMEHYSRDTPVCPLYKIWLQRYFDLELCL